MTSISSEILGKFFIKLSESPHFSKERVEKVKLLLEAEQKPKTEKLVAALAEVHEEKGA